MPAETVQEAASAGIFDGGCMQEPGYSDSQQEINVVSRISRHSDLASAFMPSGRRPGTPLPVSAGDMHVFKADLLHRANLL